MTETTTTAGRNSPEHAGSAMPPPTTTRLEQDERARGGYETWGDEGTSAELERQIERERAEVKGTLNEIRRSFSPGQLLDQALDYAKHSGGREFAENLGRSVRDNPLPLLLVGAGIAWMVTSNGRGGGARTGERPTDGASEMRERAGSAGSSAADAASRASASLSGAASSARESLSRASERGSGMATSVAEAAVRTGEAAGDRLREVAGRTGSLAHDARDSMSHAGARAREGWSRLAEEQPLLLGAIGVAVGAAIAAALPSTRTEDRLMGEASDALKDEVRETAHRQVQHAKEVATETYEDVTKDLDKRGLSKDAAADAAASTAKEVRSAANEIAEGAQAEMEQKAGRSSDVRHSSGQPDRSPSSESSRTAAASKPGSSQTETSGQPSSSERLAPDKQKK